MNSKIRKLLRTAKQTGPAWRMASNLKPTLRFWLGNTDRVTETASEIVRKLDSDGIATVPFSVLEHSVSFRELEDAANELVRVKSSEIEALKEGVDVDPAIGQKTFNMEMLGSVLTFDPTDIFARFALNSSFVNVANAYFRMHTRLRYYNVWYTASSSTEARESQLWHFDREDRRILKIFVYLNDVDSGSGPFTYAPATHKKGKLRGISPAYFDENGVRRTTDEQMSEVYQPENWKICTGRKGTVIFADTRGFHKGGEARTGDRLMFTCMYTSPASESRQLIDYPNALDTGSLDALQKSALGIY